MVFHFVDDNLLVRSNFRARSRVVSILVRHHVEQLHRTVRSSRDGQRNINCLAVRVRCSGVCRDKLVIDINRTLDEPVVSRYGVGAFILTADVVAVVNNSLRTVYEVTCRLPFYVSTSECEVASCDSIMVQCRQSVMTVECIRTRLVYVLGIYESTTHTWLHVDEVELYNTGDVAPVFLIQFIARTLFCCQLQIDT